MSGSSHYYKNGSSDRYVTGVVSHGTSQFTEVVRVNQTKFDHIIEEMDSWGQGLPCDLSSSTDHIKVQSFKIYPNPANDLVNIHFSYKTNEFEFINIYDTTGKVVLSLPFSDQIDVSEISNGIYTISIISKSEVKTQKMVILH